MRNSTRHLLPPAPVVEPPATIAPVAVGEDDTSRAATPVAQVIPVVPALPIIPPVSIDIKLEASKIPLHVAVVESILAAGAEERMKRISQNVLIVGGTGLIHNIGFAIESR